MATETQNLGPATTIFLVALSATIHPADAH